MKPTPKLRFVERYMPTPDLGENIGIPVRILQQWWASDPDNETDFMLKANGEWRDVPLEKEA
jgi:hypothetical protein